MAVTIKPSRLAFFGDGEFLDDPAGPVKLHPLHKRLTAINVQSGGLNVDLPRATPLTSHVGFVILAIINIPSSGQLLTVRDHGGTTLTTLSTNKIIRFWLEDNTTDDGVWLFEEATLL